MKLEGKVALITGSSRGMGRRMAKLLAEEGADIVLAARTESQGQSPYPGTIYEAAEEIRALGRRALPVKVDLSVPREVEGMCRRALETFGGVDILINNARYVGTGQDMFYPFLDMPVEHWNVMLAANLTAPFLACKLLVPKMIERGGGIIICTSSGAAWRENLNMPGKGSTGLAYPVTKAGLNRFVVALAKEMRQHNIAVIALDPGHTRTERVVMETAPRYGYDAGLAHSMDVPGFTARYLCTCPDPMKYSGQVLVAADFVREHGLLVRGGDG